MFPPPSLFWPSHHSLFPQTPPTTFLPQRSLSASQHITGAGEVGGLGLWSWPLQLSLVPRSLSFPSVAQSAFLFSCSLPADSWLSHRNSLCYLSSSPSSKMTFSDFTKTRQFDSVKSLQLEKGKMKTWRKKKVLASCRVHQWNCRPEGLDVKCNPSPAITITWLLACFGHVGHQTGRDEPSSAHELGFFSASHPSPTHWMWRFFFTCSLTIVPVCGCGFRYCTCHLSSKSASPICILPQFIPACS